MAATATPGRQRNRRARLLAAMIAGIAALLCLGGVGVVVSLYDEATEIDRASPDQVTSSFLRSYLVNRSDKEAELYLCKSAQLAALNGLRNDMINREKNFGTTVTATWESLAVSDGAEGTKTVAVDLLISGSANGQQVSRHSEPWSFALVDDDGWRVCGATKRG